MGGQALQSADMASFKFSVFNIVSVRYGVLATAKSSYLSSLFAIQPARSTAYSVQSHNITRNEQSLSHIDHQHTANKWQTKKPPVPNRWDNTSTGRFYYALQPKVNYYQIRFKNQPRMKDVRLTRLRLYHVKLGETFHHFG